MHKILKPSIRQMSRQVSRGSAREYQAGEWAGVAATEYDRICGFVICGLYCVEVCFLYARFVKNFIINQC